MREIAVSPDIINSVFASVENETHPERERLITLVESLPQKQRDVVELIVWGQMTKVDVAKKLGCSRSYVHKIWRNAKESMKNELLRHDN
tara:strand:- start:159 stop:425 length:267 start_codon:yes stop_codon:yes gene_type:complete